MMFKIKMTTKIGQNLKKRIETIAWNDVAYWYSTEKVIQKTSTRKKPLGGV